MSVSSFTSFGLTAVVIIACLVLHGSSMQAQARGGTPQTDQVKPVNTGANPYRVIRDWAHIEGRAWGGSNGVAIDRDGRSEEHTSELQSHSFISYAVFCLK